MIEAPPFKIMILSTDDWTAVYKNGTKVWDNHSCSIRDGLEALGIQHIYRWIEPEDAEDLTSFPEVLPE